MRIGHAFRSTFALLVAATAAAPLGASPYAFIPHASTGTVSIVDTATRTVVSVLSVGDAPMGVAIAPNAAAAYVGLVDRGEVVVIDAATRLEVHRFDVGAGPRGI